MVYPSRVKYEQRAEQSKNGSKRRKRRFHPNENPRIIFETRKRRESGEDGILPSHITTPVIYHQEYKRLLLNKQ